MSAIRFESVEMDSTIMNPLMEFGEDIQKVVLRKDPLLGDTSVYNEFLSAKATLFPESDPEAIEKLARESAQTCFFCGNGVEERTPRYPEGLLPGGRVRVGEAVLFPNLFSIGKYSPVLVLSRAHFLRLSEFTPELLSNGLKASRIFAEAVYGHDESVKYGAVSLNYLPPAGASIVHPHMQMLLSPVAYSYHRRLAEACASYMAETGVPYHLDLVREEEMAGERYAARTGAWHWMAAFSPSGGNEINAVHERECDFAKLSDADLDGLALGISRVLGLYESLGHISFNFALYSVKEQAGSSGARCLLKMITRQNLYPNYRNDDYYLQKLLHSELIINPPEELAKRLGERF